MKMTRRSAFLALTLTLAGACSQEAPPPEAAIRDARPTKLQRGEKLLIEANGPRFTVGAPTKIILGDIIIKDGKPVTIEGRAVSNMRVLADIDGAVEAQLGAGHHVLVPSVVTVEQTIDGKSVKFDSDPRERFVFDFFPASAQRLAHRLADQFHPNITDWLGIELTPWRGTQWISHVERRVDKDAFAAAYDKPPLDGKITREEARVEKGGMPYAEWRHLDKDGDGVLEAFEYEHMPETDGIGAVSGLQFGDILVAANGRPVSSEHDFANAWDTDAERVSLTVLRDGQNVVIDLPRAGAPPIIPAWIFWALILALVPGIIAIPVPAIAGLVVVWERKISAYMQSRIGPNRVGPNGWLQWLADGLKLIMKEDIIPTDADPYLFKASPYLAFIGLFLTFVVMPFSHTLIASDLNIGLLFLLSVTSLVVVSIIMGGWSSNSKWALLGGMRSAAQIISYELPASVALLTIAVLTGSLSTQKIIEAQGGMPWNWYLFHNPFTFIAFFIYFVSALAEGNRTPFDLPEAESELVSGFNTEYSGFRFSLFPMVEWVNLFVIGGVVAMLFLGGWRIPMVSPTQMETHWYWELLGFGIFLIKDIAIIFVIIWIRWTLPRFRVDQMMNLCWKYFIPLSFVCFIGTTLLVWVLPPTLTRILNFTMFGIFGVGLLGWFVSRVRYNSSRYIDLVINEPLGKANL